MMIRHILSLSSLLIGSVLLAADPVAKDDLVLPAVKKVVVGKLIIITANTASEPEWDVPDDLKRDEIGKSNDGKTIFIVAPAKKPAYELVVRAATLENGKAKLSKCLIFVLDEADPINPDPIVPPKPRPPVPVPPVPTDPLQNELAQIYAADPAPNKRDVLLSLASLYKQSVLASADGKIETVGQFANIVRAASKSLVGDGLTTYRTRVGIEIGKVLGTDAEAAFLFNTRDAAAKLFTRLQAISESIAK